VGANRKDGIGPDTHGAFRITAPWSGPEQHQLVLDCFASELQLRGNTAVSQPHFVDGTVLCWNGEVSRWRSFFIKDFYV